MSRQDIGEYLGLTLETVSRTLAHLQATAAIEVHARQIMLRDCSALRRLSLTDRTLRSAFRYFRSSR
jgi:CRP/FNR family transcriptional regulator, nitrogen fixation regulation protein